MSCSDCQLHPQGEIKILHKFLRINVHLQFMILSSNRTRTALACEKLSKNSR